MAGETRTATPVELALVEGLSDAACLVRSLILAAKEAEGAGQNELAARLRAKAAKDTERVQDEIIGLLTEQLGLTSERVWALQADPDGAITRELMLARADARAMNIHLERAMGFGAEREDRLDQRAEEKTIAAEILAKKEAEVARSAVDKVAEKAAEKAKVDDLVAKAREEGAAKRAAAAAKLAAPVEVTPASAKTAEASKPEPAKAAASTAEVKPEAPAVTTAETGPAVAKAEQVAKTSQPAKAADVAAKTTTARPVPKK